MTEAVAPPESPGQLRTASSVILLSGSRKSTSWKRFFGLGARARKSESASTSSPSGSIARLRSRSWSSAEGDAQRRAAHAVDGEGLGSCGFRVGAGEAGEDLQLFPSVVRDVDVLGKLEPEGNLGLADLPIPGQRNVHRPLDAARVMGFDLEASVRALVRHRDQCVTRRTLRSTFKNDFALTVRILFGER